MSRVSLRLVPVFLILLVAFLVVVEWPGLFWMSGWGQYPGQSFNMDDNRFVLAAADIRHAPTILNGYPPALAYQLFAISGVLARFGHAPAGIVLLRAITLIYASAAIVLVYLVGRTMKLTRIGACAASLFLLSAPIFIVLASQGTADVAVLAVLLAAIWSASLFFTTGRLIFFYACFALAGVALSVKFLLPALIPAAMIARSALPRGWDRILLGCCVAFTAFYVSCVFNFTPADAHKLYLMLKFDNVTVGAGLQPPAQIVRYGWDLPACAGVVASIVALAGAALLAARWSARRTRPTLAAAKAWLDTPAAVLVSTLLGHLILIVAAQVHFSRHVLPLVPGVALLAGYAVDRMAAALAGASSGARMVAGLVAGGVVAVCAVNAYLTGRQAGHDPRVALFTAIRRLPAPSQVSSWYVTTVGTQDTQTPPSAAAYATCDAEYERFLQARRVEDVFHTFGKDWQFGFFRDLFAGRAAYTPTAHYHRASVTIEDRAADLGLLPRVQSPVARDCWLFRHAA